MTTSEPMTPEEFEHLLDSINLDAATKTAALKGYKFIVAREANDRARRAERWKNATRICKECGSDFRLTGPADRMKVFCSDECRTANKRRKGREAYQEKKRRQAQEAAALLIISGDEPTLDEFVETLPESPEEQQEKFLEYIEKRARELAL